MIGKTLPKESNSSTPKKKQAKIIAGQQENQLKRK